MFKYSRILNFYLIFIFTLCFFSNKFERSSILNVSLLKATGSEFDVGSSSAPAAQEELLIKFDGNVNHGLGDHLKLFGVGLDLSVKQKCDGSKLKVLTKELKGILLKLFRSYAEVKRLERENQNETSSGNSPSSQLDNLKVETNEQEAVVKSLLDEIYKCILNRTAVKYSNKSMRKNNAGCSLIMFVYKSSLKTMSKVLIGAFKETLKQINKLYNECLKSTHLSLENCVYLGYSTASLDASIQAQEKIKTESKSANKRCKRYLQNGLLTRITGRNRGSNSGTLIYEDDRQIETFF